MCIPKMAFSCYQTGSNVVQSPELLIKIPHVMWGIFISIFGSRDRTEGHCFSSLPRNELKTGDFDRVATRERRSLARNIYVIRGGEFISRHGCLVRF